MTHEPAPQVELTLTVRYPAPDFDPSYAEFGIHSVADAVRDEIQSLAASPEDLAELLASDRAEVEWAFEIDDEEHLWGGEMVMSPERDRFGRVMLPAPREFHGLGDS